MSKTHVYIGNWRTAGQPTKGIAIYEFDKETGRLAYLKNVFEEFCVGAAWPDEKRGMLYITDERTDHPSMRQGGGGQIAAFSVNPENGNLAEINRKPSYGGNPAFLVTDPDAKFLLAVNHGSRTIVTQTETDTSGRIRIKTLHDESSVVLFPLEEDGFIGDPCDLFRLCGEGPGSFQLSAHAHSIQRSPSGKLYAVCDKGGDQIYMFRIDYAKKKIVQCAGGPIRCKPGSAPRYSAFAPTLPFLFVNHEYKTFVSAYRYDDEGRLSHVCDADALPAHIAPPEGAVQSDICVGKSGRYLYTVLRQVNAITAFEIEETTGRPTRIQVFENACDGGRGCAISPDGRFLVVAALSGKEAKVFPIGKDGTLSPAVCSVKQPLPGTVTFFSV
ncbi:MAG: lactonase family protein [Clostridiales Family XIII bacterium]|nr:lactonase family protein [Clostridiales Family XIII bacterium]